MKIIIDDTLRGKALTDFLIENKGELIRQKKSMLKRTEPVSCAPATFLVKDNIVASKGIADIAPDANSIRVKVVANTAYWCDNDMDVLLPDCWKKSISDRMGMIPHLHDHIHTLGAEVGDVVNIYGQELSLTELGINKVGTTQALIFETDVKKAYNEMVFAKYATGKIKFHSIGLSYVKLDIAINDEESEKEYDFWTKHFEKVINKETVAERGFFFVVSEIKLLENSCVLLGSNEITPVLDVKSMSGFQPQASTEPQSTFDLDNAIKGIKFF